MTNKNLLVIITFIWLSNYVLVYALRKIDNKFLALVVGGILKVAVLFTVANILVKLSILPKIFITSMGVFQIYTLVLGGVGALLVNNVFEN